MTLKHAFFALEACRAGGILSTLAAPPAPNPTGYLFGPTVRKHVRQFLTAGNETEDVPSGTFTSLLLAAFDEGARTDDGYIYTSDVISYVSKNAPRYTKDFPLDPSSFSIPPSGGGDMIIGRAPLFEARRKPKPSTPSYLACRIPENGVDSWGIDQPWAAQSAWLGGGNNQSSVCEGLAAGWMQAHPGHKIEITSMGEESNKDVFGHVEYRYFCKGIEKAYPIYKLANSPSCGVDPGSQPSFVDSETVYLESGGTSDNRSDVCNIHQAEVCVTPSSGSNGIIPGSARFVVAERAGRVYVDGNPANNNPVGTSNIGWFISQDKNSPGKICATVYARTSACETRVFIKGKLVAQEVRSEAPPSRVEGTTKPAAEMAPVWYSPKTYCDSLTSLLEKRADQFALTNELKTNNGTQLQSKNTAPSGEIEDKLFNPARSQEHQCSLFKSSAGDFYGKCDTKRDNLYDFKAAYQTLLQDLKMCLEPNGWWHDPKANAPALDTGMPDEVVYKRSMIREGATMRQVPTQSVVIQRIPGESGKQFSLRLLWSVQASLGYTYQNR